MAKNQQPQQISYLGPEAVASISFLKTRELMFTWQQDDRLQSKLITNEAAFLAFKEGHQQDTGWLPAGVLRTGSNARGEWVVYTACGTDDRYCDRQKREIESSHSGDPFYGLGFPLLFVGAPQQEIRQKASGLQGPLPKHLR